MRQGGSRPGRRSGPAVLAAAVLVLALAGAAGGYLLLRTHGSPQQTAARYLLGWQRGSFPAMDKVSVNVPRSGLAGPLSQAAAQLGIRHIRLVPGRVTVQGGSAQARFTATDELASGHSWTYQGQLRLVRRARRWWVSWSPAAIYPGLRAGERFMLHAAWPARAPVLAADGSVLSSPRVTAQSGSISLLTGDVVAATAAQARALGAPYHAGDLIGQGGIEQAYQDQLAGRPSLTIEIVGPGTHIDATAAGFAALSGTPVRTGIEMRDQLAASAAVRSAATAKPVDMVVLQPSTGRVLAVVERPGGFDRALEGEFPPGSTFKVVTASALARTGMRPSSTVQCPSQVTVDGRTFHNDNNEHLGTVSLQTAFAVSCNSTFAMLTLQRLGGAALASMARTFGFNARPALGIPGVLGRFTTPRQPVDLAAAAFGQGTDLVSPLSQAAVAAAIEDGAWRPPQLVLSPAPRQAPRPRRISPAILDTLRPMMRAVVISGTAARVGFPAGVYGKTGTAQYGTGANPPSHGWFIGYRGDLAFAVLVEGGGTGADSAGPIANAFLRKS
jgi:Penicillin binding protein transpeptidase domain/NTF2-like N-terminal transpeptidase domain